MCIEGFPFMFDLTLIELSPVCVGVNEVVGPLPGLSSIANVSLLSHHSFWIASSEVALPQLFFFPITSLQEPTSFKRSHAENFSKVQAAQKEKYMT